VKTYLVQTWGEGGALKNHYEVVLTTAREVADLRKFLRKSFAHVTITPVSKSRGAK
jgi:hypothetical protein